MFPERSVSLQPYNSFGIQARAHTLVRLRTEADVLAVLADAEWGPSPKFVLGGGSNIVLTGDVRPLVLKVEIAGRRLAVETGRDWIVEAGAGENWHELVRWTLQQGWPGLENLALIPGTVGAAPVQNIGAYGLELQDRFEALDGIDLRTGQAFTLNAAQCAFGYRDSVFKHATATGLLGKAVITAVRFALPKAWRPELSYADLSRKYAEFLSQIGTQPSQNLRSMLLNQEQVNWRDIPPELLPSASVSVSLNGRWGACRKLRATSVTRRGSRLPVRR